MRTRLLGLLVLVLPGVAVAHPVDTAALELRSEGEVVTATLDIALPAALDAAQLPPGTDLSPQGIAKLAPALFAATLGSGALTSDGAPCRWGQPAAAVTGIRLQLRAAARCDRPPGTLHWTLPFVEQEPPTFRIIGTANLDGVAASLTAGPGRETLVLEGPPRSHLSPRALGLDGRFLAALVLLLGSTLGARPRPRLGRLAAALLGLALGIVLARAGLAVAPLPLRVAGVLAALLPCVLLVSGKASPAPLPVAALGGLVLGLALAPAQLLALILAAAAVWALGLVPIGKAGRPLAALLAVAALASLAV